MVNSTGNIFIIIAAAGSGSRFGSPLPKQFCPLGGIPVICQTIRSMKEALPQAIIITVISREHEDTWLDIKHGHAVAQDVEHVYGGATRSESVFNALKCVETNFGATDNDIVLIHDAARPLVTRKVITDALTPVLTDPEVHGTVPVTDVTDTLRYVDDSNGIPQRSHTVDRSRYKAVQTPQCFRLRELIDAYRRNGERPATDDASVMENTGYARIILTPGDTLNFKITSPEDLSRAETALERCMR